MMKEDLIERLTSMVFSDDQFSKIVLSLCRELTKVQELKYCKRLEEISGLKPKDVGISLYLTLDNTSNMEQVFMQSKKKNSTESGDVGGSNPNSMYTDAISYETPTILSESNPRGEVFLP